MTTLNKNKPAAKAKRDQGGWLETIKTIVSVVLIVLVIRTFLFEPFNIPSGSMVPTLLVGDYIFVSKYSYGYSKYSFPFINPPFSGRVWGSLPKRGDVAVFRLPTDPSIDYVKRIVGLPGDTLQVKHGLLYVNGQPVKRTPGPIFLDDEYGSPEPIRQFFETLPGGKTHPILQKYDDGELDNTAIYTVPPGHVFGMGDNRDNSEDSRVLSAVGYIPVENLVGKAEFRFFSFDSNTPWWEIWRWPFAIRWSRLFTPVE
ncbi:MAG TPA: signal peptidase I [Stellaceae bacterium]|jgi:signal peptidase I|nr:signal peptidase I [Stellaceae bacterium]